MAKRKYRQKKSGKSTRSKRSAAGRKAWRTKVARYGKARALAMSFGGKRARKSGSRKRPSKTKRTYRTAVDHRTRRQMRNVRCATRRRSSR